MPQELWREFVESCAQKLELDLWQLSRCARLLSVEQLWRRANNSCNSVAVLLLHLRGNVGQWIVSGVGGGPFPRDRAAEFGARGPLPTEQVVEPLRAVVAQAVSIIREQSQEKLVRRLTIQRYDVSVMQAILHVTEHFSFHTGQVVHITKAILECDLSLYDATGRPGFADGTVLERGENPWQR